ncbi:MAG: hypothetical protein WCO44_08590 [Bacteroidota bacterium]
MKHLLPMTISQCNLGYDSIYQGFLCESFSGQHIPQSIANSGLLPGWLECAVLVHTGATNVPDPIIHRWQIVFCKGQNFTIAPQLLFLILLFLIPFYASKCANRVQMKKGFKLKSSETLVFVGGSNRIRTASRMG